MPPAPAAGTDTCATSRVSSHVCRSAMTSGTAMSAIARTALSSSMRNDQVSRKRRTMSGFGRDSSEISPSSAAAPSEPASVPQTQSGGLALNGALPPTRPP